MNTLNDRLAGVKYREKETDVGIDMDIHRMYIDVSSVKFPGSVHLHIEDLAKAVPQEYREKVYCMHFNDDKCIEMAKELGFQIVEVYGQES